MFPAEVNDVDLSGTSASDPSLKWYYMLHAYSYNGVNTNLQLQVHLEMRTRFFSRLLLVQS